MSLVIKTKVAQNMFTSICSRSPTLSGLMGSENDHRVRVKSLRVITEKASDLKKDIFKYYDIFKYDEVHEK